MTGACLGALSLSAACGSSNDDATGDRAGSPDAGSDVADASLDARGHDATTPDAAKLDGQAADATTADASAGDAAADSGPVVFDGGGGYDTNVHFSARLDARDPDGPRFDWSGSSFSASFTGTGIAVHLGNTDTGSGPNELQVVIDGTPSPTALVLTDADAVTYTLASGLTDATHTVAVYKRTEGYYGAVQFEGFFPEDPGDTDWKLVPSTPPTRHIEIIGDSISAGYGVLSPSICCDSDQYIGFQDEYLAYGLDAARALDASAVSIAYSGTGIYRDYSGTTSNQSNTYYPLTLCSGLSNPDDELTYDFSQQVDAVLINYGTNDLHDGDPGQENFESAYLDLIATVRGHYPSAYILLLTGPMVNNVSPYKNALKTLDEYVNDVATTRQDDYGDTQIGVLELAPQDCGSATCSTECACDSHPTVATQQSMSDSIVAALRTAKGW